MPQLDSLRALAFFGIAASHWLAARTRLSTLGGPGVQLFFVLSGFLITGILLDYRKLQEGSQGLLSAGSALRTFYIRRFFRIFPLFYGVIVAALIFDIGPIRQLWPWHISYGSNFLYAAHRPSSADPFRHFWSLAVEEQFYLVWPFLIFFVRLATLKRLIFGLVILAPLFRIGMDLAYPTMYRVNYLPLSCVDALGIGGYLAFASRHQNLFSTSPSTLARRLGATGLAGGILMAGLMGIKGRVFWLESIGHAALVFVFAWIVFGAARGFRGPLGWLLNLSQLRFLGKISYGLYVFHHFFTGLDLPASFARLGLPANWAQYIVVQVLVRFLLTLSLASLSWFLYEKPLNDLKRFFTLEKKLPAPRLETPAAATNELSRPSPV